MLTLLAALLFSGPPAARAEDAPPPAAAEDSRDANHDGTVSGKERRRARRSERRARRGEKNASGETAVDEEQDAADAEESAERGRSASGAAAGAAAALKSSMPSLDAAAMPPGAGGTGGPPASPGAPQPGDPAAKAAGGSAALGSGGAAAGGFKPSAHSAGASGDPGKPRAPSDFVLAARSGYAPAFASAGLKLSADGRSIVRLDGSPASADDYTRLQREISAMPAALGRRPDFFNAISPERYADLKGEYKTNKDDPNFKDVGTTEGDRDFVHTASCDRLSGDCNKNVEKGGYKKGEYVAPEDLDAMWNALQKQIDGSSAAEDGMSLSAKGETLARETAVEAAEAISGEKNRPAAARAAAAGTAEASPAAAAVAQAVAAARNVFRGAMTIARPGRGAEGGADRSALAVAAAVLGALAAGVLLLRRR